MPSPTLAAVDDALCITALYWLAAAAALVSMWTTNGRLAEHGSTCLPGSAGPLAKAPGIATGTASLPVGKAKVSVEVGGQHARRWSGMTSRCPQWRACPVGARTLSAAALLALCSPQWVVGPSTTLTNVLSLAWKPPGATAFKLASLVPA